MPIIEFSKRDILRGTVVTPAWYRIRIDNTGEAPAKIVEGKPPSINYPIEATILFNGDTGDTTFTEVPLEWLFNSRAMGFATGYIAALGYEPKPGRFELKGSEGMEIDVFVENDTYQGRVVNRVNHKYRVPRADVTAVVKQGE